MSSNLWNFNIVQFSEFKMEYSLNSMILLSYSIPKYSRTRYTRTFKKVLPRKKTSSMRIMKNRQWNLLEESCQRKFNNFLNLDFSNEINDNIENEIRERISKGGDICQTQHSPSNANILHSNTTPASNLLTPPSTPQVGYESFQFSMEQATINQTAELEEEGLPLTPCDSEVFFY